MERYRRDRNLYLSPLEENLLTVLLGHQLYGLDIIKAVEEGSEGRCRIGFGSLYPTLHKLEKRGFVKSQWGKEKPQKRSGARRRYYRLTGLGERALRETQEIRASLMAWQPVH